MEITKKTAPKRQLRSGIVQGFSRGTKSMMIITDSRRNASPNLDKRGGIFPVSWEFMLTVIGSGFLVSQLSRFIDWIERG